MRRPHWRPGLIAGQSSDVTGEAVSSLNYAEVYPFGLMAQISVRFRGPMEIEQMREIAQEAQSYLRGNAANGPRLNIKQQGTEEAVAEVLTMEGSSTLWTISFWLEAQITRNALLLHFSWPEREISEHFSVTTDNLNSALDQSREIWNPGHESYIGK